MSNCTIVWYKCWCDITIVQSDVTIVVPWQLSTGSEHDYLFCYCPLVGIQFEVLRNSVSDFFYWRACWFLPLWSGLMHTSWGKYAWIHVPVGLGSRRFGPLLEVNIYRTILWGGGVKDFSGISLNYLPVPPELRNVHELMSWWRGRGGGQNGSQLDSQKRLNDYLQWSKFWGISHWATC